VWFIEGELFVHLVGQDQKIMLDSYSSNGVKIPGPEHGAGGVVGTVDNNHRCLVRDCRAQGIFIDPKARAMSFQRDRNERGASQSDRRRVGIEVGLEGDDFSPGLDEPQN
jgi:hypothetical protein